MAAPDGNHFTAFVAHTIPGRTRLRVPEPRHDAPLFARIAEDLLRHPRVKRVTVNAHTGSILLSHDGSLRELIDDLSGSITIVPHPPVARVPSVKRQSVQFTRATALQALALGSVALGIWQARRGRLLASTLEHVWHAYGAWRNLKAPTLAAAMAGGALVQLGRGQILSSAASLAYYAARLRRMSTARDEPPS
jgi:Heavy metal associated domain 2